MNAICPDKLSSQVSFRQRNLSLSQRLLSYTIFNLQRKVLSQSCLELNNLKQRRLYL